MPKKILTNVSMTMMDECCTYFSIFIEDIFELSAHHFSVDVVLASFALSNNLISSIRTLSVPVFYDLKTGMNLSYSSYRPGAIHPNLLIILVLNS